MEATQAFQRCFSRALAHTTRCTQTINQSTTTTKKLLVASKSNILRYQPTCPTSSSSIRTFTSSSTRKLPSPTTEPQPGAPAGNIPPLPAGSNEARQALESYVANVQKISDVHQLQKTALPRDYERVIKALSTAEAHLGARNQAQESYEPALRSFQAAIQPILQKQFKTSDVETIASTAPGATPFSQPIPPRSSPFPAPPPPFSSSTQPTPSTPRHNPAYGLVGGDMLDVFRKESNSGSTSLRARQDTTNASESRRRIDGLMSQYGLPPPPQRNTSRAGMMDPKDPTLTAAQNLELLDRMPGFETGPEIVPRLRLKPSLGRTVAVTSMFDVTRAFRQLEGSCARNKVKADERLQRKHVRQGQMRKLLRMQRWRKLFKQGFVAETERVRRMWRQGW